MASEKPKDRPKVEEVLQKLKLKQISRTFIE